jgi:outer membrane protein insertion porin family
MRLTTAIRWLPLLLLPATATAFEPFRIEQLEIEGLQRIAIGTVYNYLPLQVGDLIDIDSADAAIHALYQTGFFKDIVLEHEAGRLTLFLAERPAIASISISGNDAIPTDQLLENLKRIGFAEGRVFNRSLLDKVK